MKNSSKLIYNSAIVGFILMVLTTNMLSFVNMTNIVALIAGITLGSGFMFSIHWKNYPKSPFTVMNVYCFGAAAIFVVSLILIIWQYVISIDSDWVAPIPGQMIATGTVMFISGIVWYVLAGKIENKLAGMRC